MSRHWKPDDDATSLQLPRGGKRLRSLDEFDRDAWFERVGRPTPKRWPPGATAGIVMVAAACLGLSMGLYWAAGPRDVFAEELESERNAAQVP